MWRQETMKYIDTINKTKLYYTNIIMLIINLLLRFIYFYPDINIIGYAVINPLITCLCIYISIYLYRLSCLSFLQTLLQSTILIGNIIFSIKPILTLIIAIILGLIGATP